MIPGGIISLANDRFGNPNSSLFLDSSYCTVDPGIYFDGGDFTVSGWILPLDLANSPYYILLDFSNGKGIDNVYISYSVGSTSQMPEIEIYNSASGLYTYTDSTIGLNLNVWNHLVAVLSGTTTMIYVNGTLGVTLVGSTLPTNINRTSCKIGRSSWYPTEKDAIAYFDDIRIYNVALDQSQINNLYLGA